MKWNWNVAYKILSILFGLDMLLYDVLNLEFIVTVLKSWQCKYWNCWDCVYWVLVGCNGKSALCAACNISQEYWFLLLNLQHLSSCPMWGLNWIIVLQLGTGDCTCILCDDAMIWKCFQLYWPFVRGIHLSTSGFALPQANNELWCFPC